MINLRHLPAIYVGKVWRKIFGTQPSRKPLYAVRHYVGKRPSQRALLSYRVHGLRANAKSTFSSIGDVHSIIRALSELGYVTDVIDYDDATFRVAKPYDLFIGHWGKNFEWIYSQLPKETVSIFYPMYPYWKFLNETEAERIANLERRRGVRLQAERVMQVGDDFALSHADGIILMSNERGKHTYPNPEKILTIPNASYERGFIDLEKKDFAAGRNNILWLSGSGNVHKGMDLALDAFTQMGDKHLYICSKLEPDFADVYKKELFETPNIHYVGLIRIYSKQFFDLCRQCNTLLFPSSSEGCPGSVVDAMFQGIIPMVTLASHIDLGPHGKIIEPCTIEHIIRAVSEMGARDAVSLKAESIAVQTYAREQFSVARYITILKQHIQTIVTQKTAGSAQGNTPAPRQ